MSIEIVQSRIETLCIYHINYGQLTGVAGVRGNTRSIRPEEIAPMTTPTFAPPPP
jgi:hypothetical protein